MSFHIGDEIVHLDQWLGQPVDIVFRFLRPAAITELLVGAGLTVTATLDREPVPDVEPQTRRCYVVARR